MIVPKTWLVTMLLLAAPALAAEERLPEQANDDPLPAGVRSVLDVRNIQDTDVSLFVVDIESGDVLLEWNADEPRNPASTIKLITTLVGLDVLGPAYTWSTDIYALGDVDNGRLDGDLLIKGHGDPFLVTERVWQMLRLVRQYGIQEIGGDLLIDDSYFQVPDYDPAAFDNQPLRAYNVAPNALLMNFKVVRYWFEPDFDKNAVRVLVDPPLDNLKVENQLSLRQGSCRGYQRGISISANESFDEIALSGRFPTGCKRYAMDRAVLDHAEFAYGLFSSLWRELGGSFDGDWRRALAPEDQEPLLEFRSLPLGTQIKRINKYSNNVMARQLLYTLAAEDEKLPPTEAAGRHLVKSWLAERGLDGPGFVLENGAGLSRESRISARQFGKVLSYAWRQPYMPEFLASMSLSGLDGTGRRRFDDPTLSGLAHLKTGSLDHVSAVSGYMQSRSGRRFALVALQNAEDIHRGPGDEVHIALMKWLNEQ